MKLAVCVTPEQPCPPINYGGNEMQADILVRRLMSKGHTVDLFCAPSSTCPASQRFCAPEPSMKHEPLFAHHIEFISKKAPAYDCIIDMTAFHLPSQDAYQIACPSIAIMTGDPHKKYPHDSVRNRVYVSPQLAEHFGCGGWPVLHNIIHDDPCGLPLGRGEGGHALYLGTIRPEKGIDLAAEAAYRAGLQLIVAGPVQVRFADYATKLLNLPAVNYIGPVRTVDKWDILGKAAVFLYPVQWCDAGPLGVMEALACGTPVVGVANGGICEDVVSGKNGYLASREVDREAIVSEMVEGIRNSLVLDRASVKQSIIPKINPDTHAAKVERLCERAARGDKW